MQSDKTTSYGTFKSREAAVPPYADHRVHGISWSIDSEPATDDPISPPGESID